MSRYQQISGDVCFISLPTLVGEKRETEGFCANLHFSGNKFSPPLVIGVKSNEPLKS